MQMRMRSFGAYIANLVLACTRAGATFHYGTDVTRSPELLAPFDRIVIATGAQYRFGLGSLPAKLVDLGAGRWPGLRRIFSSPRFRDGSYYKARQGTGSQFPALARPGQKVAVVGDAVKAGTSKPVIASAFEAALLSHA
jgi:hypothetical protein